MNHELGQAMAFDFSGRCALVTGAGGIGEATAQLLARCGARVALVDCDRQRAEAAAAGGDDREKMRATVPNLIAFYTGSPA